MSETKTSAYIGVSGADLRLLRIMLGLSAHEVADISGYYVSSVRSMENCFYRPSDKVIYALADYVSKDAKAHERLQHVKSLLGLLEPLEAADADDSALTFGLGAYVLEFARMADLATKYKERLSAAQVNCPGLAPLMEEYDFELAKLRIATSRFADKIKLLDTALEQLVKRGEL